jgi:hypothetical protein
MRAIRRSEEMRRRLLKARDEPLFLTAKGRKGEFSHATPQDLSHGISGARADVGIERGHGAVSTDKSGFESAGMGKTHGSAAGERVGNRAVGGFAVVGE